MKNIIFIFTIISLFSCSTNTTISKEEINTNIAGTTEKTCQQNNLVTFKAGGQEINTTGWSISRFSFSNNPAKVWLNITTNMHDEKETININLNGSTPGIYNLGENGDMQSGSHGSYYPDYMGDITNSYSFTSGSFIITSIDTLQRAVNANFYGIVKNTKGETLEITDGIIMNGLLNMGIIKY